MGSTGRSSMPALSWPCSRSFFAFLRLGLPVFGFVPPLLCHAFRVASALLGWCSGSLHLLTAGPGLEGGDKKGGRRRRRSGGGGGGRVSEGRPAKITPGHDRIMVIRELSRAR